MIATVHSRAAGQNWAHRRDVVYGLTKVAVCTAIRMGPKPKRGFFG